MIFLQQCVLLSASWDRPNYNNHRSCVKMGHLLTVLMVLLWSRITLFCWTKSKWSAICNLSRRVGSGIRVWRWHAVRWIEVRLWHVRWKSAICNCTWDYICCATKHSIIMITKKLSSRYFQAVIHLWLPWAISNLLQSLSMCLIRSSQGMFKTLLEIFRKMRDFESSPETWQSPPHQPPPLP